MVESAERLKRLRTAKIVLTIAIFIFSIVFLLFAIVLIVTIYSSSEQSDEAEPIIHRYYYSEPGSNETSSGLLWLPEEEESSFTYEISSGSYTLVSTFERTEYRCTGSCYCETERKSVGSASHTLSRGLIFLVASLTSVLAYEKALDYFEEVCENEELFDSCLTQVSSTVENCEEIKSVSSCGEEGILERREKDKEGKYECFGRCRPVEDFVELLFHTSGYEEADRSERKVALKTFKKKVKKAMCLQKAISVVISVDQIVQPMFELHPNPEEKFEDNDLEGYRQLVKDIRSGNLAGESAAASLFLNHYLTPLCGRTKEYDLILCEPWKGYLTGEEPEFKPELNPSVKCVKNV